MKLFLRQEDLPFFSVALCFESSSVFFLPVYLESVFQLVFLPKHPLRIISVREEVFNSFRDVFLCAGVFLRSISTYNHLFVNGSKKNGV